MDSYLLKAEHEEMGLWRMSAQGYPSFAAWLRDAAREKCGRDGSGVGQRTVVSSDAVEAVRREQAQRMLNESGRCTADVARGTRCRICREYH